MSCQCFCGDPGLFNDFTSGECEGRGGAPSDRKTTFKHVKLERRPAPPGRTDSARCHQGFITSNLLLSLVEAASDW